MLSNLFDIERLIHSVKTMVACLIGLLLLRFIGVNGGQWVIITIIVVMCAQIYVGSVIQKGSFRFLGTLIGCLFATIALLLGGDSFFSISITICLSSFIFSYAATSQENLIYAGTLGAVTTAIIMLGQKPTVLYAGERFLEISLGIFIATLVSQFILPIHARTHLRRTQAKTLEQLRLRYQDCMTNRPVTDESLSYEELDESIVKLLTKQRQLAKEATREPFGEIHNPILFFQSLHAEKEILRAIDFMNHALRYMKQADFVLSQSNAFKLFNEEIIQALAVLAKAASTSETIEGHIHIPTITQLKQDLTTHLSLLQEEDWMYVDGLLFGALILIENLEKLALLYKVPVYRTPLQSS